MPHIHHPRAARRAFTLLGLGLLLGLAACAPSRVQESSRLVKQSEPFQSNPARAAGSLLIVGDSTAVGTGATSPARSVAGLIAQDHPRLRIVNRAEDGARFEDMARQLADNERFDMVLIMGGGNDVIRMTGREAWHASMERVTERARERSSTVILMPSGNVGNAPMFYPPLSWLMTERAQTLQSMAREIANANGVIYVGLYRERQDDPFAQQPDRYNASDRLHPSDAGYAFWYGELRAQAGLDQRLATVTR